jgi:hypothetical protein
MPWDHVAATKREVIARWATEPDFRPVRVTSIGPDPTTHAIRDPMFWVEGWITAFSFVRGRTLNDVERILGLNDKTLKKGAYFYQLKRLPAPHEFELEGYSHRSPVDRRYPRGLGAPQWFINKNTFIPGRVTFIESDGTIPSCI